LTYINAWPSPLSKNLEADSAQVLRNMARAKDITVEKHRLGERLLAAGCSIEDAEKSLSVLASTLERVKQLEHHLQSLSYWHDPRLLN
jgi:hypothetical protein